MKGYYHTKQLRLVGKAWEVRAMLRDLSKRHPPAATLQQWLDERAAEASAAPEPASRVSSTSTQPVTRSAPFVASASRACAAGDYRCYPMA